MKVALDVFYGLFFVCYALQAVGSFGVELICNNTPGLTDQQRQICRQMPETMVIMNDVVTIFQNECTWQFKTNRWNCSGVTSPVYRSLELEEGRESAFIYALTSAITTQQVATACNEQRLGNFCSCDNSQSGIRSPEGWRWGCSHDINYGMRFAQNFLDTRELSFDASDTVAASKSIIHLHNNAVGRKVIQDNSHLRCRCHGPSGTCTIETCWKEVPNVFEVGDHLKTKYDEAVKVYVNIPRNGGSAILQAVDQRREQQGSPSYTELIFLQTSTNQCSVNPEITSSRYCIPRSELTPSLRRFYPPCEDFCCSGEYKSAVKSITQSCNCLFVYCCELQCQTCEKMYTEYTCTSTRDSNSTSSGLSPT